MTKSTNERIRKEGERVAAKKNTIQIESLLTSITVSSSGIAIVLVVELQTIEPNADLGFCSTNLKCNL